jgi:hypothetical protein
MSWTLVTVTGLILFALLYAQREHYHFLEQMRMRDEMLEESHSFEEMAEEIDKCKKRMDVLTLKAGLKL